MNEAEVRELISKIKEILSFTCRECAVIPCDKDMDITKCNNERLLALIAEHTNGMVKLVDYKIHGEVEQVTIEEGNEIVCYGTPYQDEPEEDSHNCDSMGCASVGGHVLAIRRVEVSHDR